MNRMLKRIKQKPFTGDTPKLTGDYTILTGDCTELRGDCTGLCGDCTEQKKQLSLFDEENNDN